MRRQSSKGTKERRSHSKPVVSPLLSYTRTCKGHADYMMYPVCTTVHLSTFLDMHPSVLHITPPATPYIISYKYLLLSLEYCYVFVDAIAATAHTRHQQNYLPNYLCTFRADPVPECTRFSSYHNRSLPLAPKPPWFLSLASLPRWSTHVELGEIQQDPCVSILFACTAAPCRN